MAKNSVKIKYVGDPRALIQMLYNSFGQSSSSSPVIIVDMAVYCTNQRHAFNEVYSLTTLFFKPEGLSRLVTQD